MSMRQIATTICLCFVVLLFSGCVEKTVYIYKKYPRPEVRAPEIDTKCSDVKCVLINYQKQKDYAGNLRDALDAVTEVQ